MDPFSLVAGILTILGTTSHTYKALLSLYKLKDAPHEVLELVNEVLSESFAPNQEV